MNMNINMDQLNSNGMMYGMQMSHDTNHDLNMGNFAMGMNVLPISPSNSDGMYDPNDFSGKNNRNRGNYNCSKCGKPKKGHVCPLVPRNFKCNRCGLSKKQCTCVAVTTQSVACQAELDEDMTVRLLDLKTQGMVPILHADSSVMSPPTYSSPSLLPPQ